MEVNRSEPGSKDTDFVQAEKYAQDLVKLFALEKEKRDKLELSNQKLQAVFSATPDGLAVLDHQFNIEEANPAFWTLIEKLPPEQGLPVPLTQVLPYPELMKELEKSLSAAQELSQIELDIEIAKSVIRTLQIVVAPLSAGDRRGQVLIVHDLTERKRLETLKNEFINIAAHELRTPLAAVLGFSQVLKDSIGQDGDDLAIHLVDTILKSSNRLKGIIDELIEFADIHYQREDPQHAEIFDLVSTLEQVIQTLNHRAVEDEITITSQFPAKTIEFIGSQTIIKEVFTHLIENAIIFTEQGGNVTVCVSETEDNVIVKVEDNGIGIAQKELKKIFDKFYQVQNHLTRSVGGLGLGLAIVQRGVNLHGGVISVKSALNEGSCFTVELPKLPPPSNPYTEQGLKLNYDQTIAFGRDLARAVAAEKAIAKRLKRIKALSVSLQQFVAQNPASNKELESLIEQLTNEF